MDISLINAYSTRNVGDAAIYRALAILSKSPATLSCQLAEDSCLKIPGIDFHEESCRKSDLYVSVGGDIFNNGRPKMLTRTFLRNLNVLAAPPSENTIVFGQSIPRSCRSLAFRLLVGQLRKLSSVTVRDAESYQRLRHAGVAARLSYDTAFVLKPVEPGLCAARARYFDIGVMPERAAVISIRGFDNMYPVDNQPFLHKIIRLCKLFTERGLTPVILKQSDAHGSDNDQAMLDEIVRQVPAARCIDPFVPALRAHPWETAISVLQLARVAVAVRYHTAVFRALSGQAAYNLYYSNKGEDLVKRLGMPGQSIDSFDPDRDVDAVIRGSAQKFDIEAVRKKLQLDFAFARRATQGRRAA